MNSEAQLSSKRERTRHAIILAAIRVIAENGLEATSIDDLMAVAGMARGSFYNYFQTREQLLQAVVTAIQNKLDVSVIQHIPEHLPASAIVACMMGAYLQFGLDNPEIGATMIRIGGMSSWDEMHHDSFKRIDDAMEQLIDEKVSLLAAIRYLEGISNNLLCNLHRGRLDPEEVEQTVLLALSGLGVPADEIPEAMNTAREFVSQIHLKSESLSDQKKDPMLVL